MEPDSRTENCSLEDLTLRLAPNIHAEIRQSRVLLIEPSGPAWLVTNPNSARLLTLFERPKHVATVLDKVGFPGGRERVAARNVIDKAHQLGLLYGRAPKQSTVRPKKPGSAHISVTTRCNLRCIYCYADAGDPRKSELSVDTWKAIVGQVVSFAGPINFVFTGGEPTLFPGLVHVMDFAKSLGSSIQLVTNGCWNSDVDAKQLAYLSDQIIVSVDGSSPDVNDRLRGHGSFQRTLNTVRLLQDSGALVQVAVVVNQLNASDLHAMRVLFESMGISVRFQPIYSMGRGVRDKEILITASEYYQALKDADEMNDLQLFDRPLELRVRTSSCGIGLRTLSLDSDGTVYPCHLMHRSEFALGNITRTSFVDIWNSPLRDKWECFTVDNITECSDCSVKYLCGGQCRARSLAHAGSVWEQDPYCEYFQKAILDFLFSSGEWVGE